MSITLQHAGTNVEVLDGPYLSHGQPTPVAVVYYSTLIANIGELKRYAAQSLLPLYNNVWLDDEIGQLDEQTFMQKLARPSVHVYDEIGAALVYFDDGGIFAGHSIEITIKNGSPCHAQILG